MEFIMKNLFFLSTVFLLSMNSFAGAFSTDVAIKSNLSIHLKGAKELVLDSAGSNKLQATFTEVEFDYMPTFGRGDLIIKQGPSLIKLKIPKDRYHNEGEFTLYSVDSGLTHDIYVRRSAPRVVNTMNVREDAHCTYNKFKGVSANGAIISEGHPGTQKVLNQYNKINRDYTLSFVRDQKSEGTVKQTLESTTVQTIQVITTCLPKDLNVLLR